MRNLDLPLSYRNLKSRERASLVCDTLDASTLSVRKDLYPSQLSGGSSSWGRSPRRRRRPQTDHGRRAPPATCYSSQGMEIMELFRKLNAEGTTYYPGDALGNPTPLRRPHRCGWRRVDGMKSLLQDLRYALRGWRRRPGVVC